MQKSIFRGVTIVIAALFTISCIITPANAALSWTIKTLDSEGNVGVGASIALDNLGNPWISYSLVVNGGSDYYLKTAHFTGTSWVISVVDTTADSFTAIAVDSSGNPGIVYEDLKNQCLQYAHFSGSAWNIETVEKDITGAGGVSIAFDGDTPHISFIDGTEFDTTTVKYATPSGESWSIVPVSIACHAAIEDTTSIALDSSGNPSICYYDSVLKALFYAQAPAWTPTKVDSTVSQLAYPSLKFNSADIPCVSYVKAYNLIYAHLNGETWDKTSVDSSGNIGYQLSFAFDYADYPHICYYNKVSYDLKYAVYDGVSWNTEVIENIGKCSAYDSIVLDSTGNPYIAYYNGNYDVKCAYSVLMKAPSVTPESDGVGVLLFAVLAASGCYIVIKRKTT